MPAKHYKSFQKKEQTPVAKNGLVALTKQRRHSAKIAYSNL